MTASKIVAAAASGVGGAGLDVDEVFHTEVYDGNGNVNIRTTGIDIATEGGLLWFKTRTGSTATNHCLIDTERPDTGSGYPYLQTNSTAANEITETPFYAGSGIEPTTTGYQLGQTDQANKSGQTYVNWTFRKAPKFFDVVTYTGNGSSGHSISHSLGSVPGMIIVKNLDDASLGWRVWHRSLTNPYSITLNSTGAASSDAGYFTTTDPTSSVFYVGDSGWVNQNSSNFVAYLFAHNNNDGEFGPDSDQDVIKCGSYTGNGSSTGPTVDLGFEPQWLMIKSADTAKEWRIHDVMRGMPVGGSGAFLQANSSAAESTDSGPVAILPNGFQLSQGGSETNNSGTDYIYIAIRRGPLAPPESATDVFAIDTRGSTGDGNEPAFRSTFPVDFALQKIKNSATNWTAKTRLIGQKDLNPNTTSAEQGANYNLFDYMNGHFARTNTDANEVGWMWKRAPSYFDVVAYTGNNNYYTSQNVTHNLGVVPEMIWIKNRNRAVSWTVYNKTIGAQKKLDLDGTSGASANDSAYFNNTTPTSSVFTVGNSNRVNQANESHVAYLFATVAGVSKVGSFVGSDSDQTIDCGFSSGARFVLIKSTTATQNWAVWDTTRGIVSGNEPYLVLDRLDAEITGQDRLDPHSSGFTVAGNFTTGNDAGESYIFYAIA